MQAISVVLGAALLRKADRVARNLRTSRSALFREALKAHLRRLEIADQESRDREGYLRRPDSLDAPGSWDKAAAWPVVNK